MFDGADTIVLYDELAFQDVLPTQWRNQTGGTDREVAENYGRRNVRVLQSWAAMDEQSTVEKPDESAPFAADLMRLNLKVDLLLDIVGQILITNRPRPPAVSVRFNSLGAIFRGQAPLPETGAQGVLEIYLRDCIAEPLRLLGRVTNVAPDGHIKVRFLPPGEAVADLIEKLAFRSHRRQIAGTRQPRRG